MGTNKVYLCVALKAYWNITQIKQHVAYSELHESLHVDTNLPKGEKSFVSYDVTMHVTSTMSSVSDGRMQYRTQADLISTMVDARFSVIAPIIRTIAPARCPHLRWSRTAVASNHYLFQFLYLPSLSLCM